MRSAGANQHDCARQASSDHRGQRQQLENRSRGGIVSIKGQRKGQHERGKLKATLSNNQTQAAQCRQESAARFKHGSDKAEHSFIN